MAKNNKYKCVVACTDANGDAALRAVVVLATEPQYDDGMHFVVAKQAVEAEGYDGPYVIFDSGSPSMPLLVGLFDWEAEPVLMVETVAGHQF